VDHAGNGDFVTVTLKGARVNNEFSPRPRFMRGRGVYPPIFAVGQTHFKSE
jgi:hypothetical protein